ncbi:hypothetical protein QYF61_012761 [Mycteria americana]|uniref:Uncharacterized protein n=1 Tax=Mycteria americana TaxID=33587 RepID=A0AAN7MVD3_MYCAM|nr:hypothetical protein QYF61_012761 [Mycteria americana]
MPRLSQGAALDLSWQAFAHQPDKLPRGRHFRAHGHRHSETLVANTFQLCLNSAEHDKLLENSVKPSPPSDTGYSPPKLKCWLAHGIPQVTMLGPVLTSNLDDRAEWFLSKFVRDTEFRL